MLHLKYEPFNVENHTGFVWLMKLVASDKYFSETLIPEMYLKVCLKVQDALTSISHVSLTTDIWSSVAQDSYISLTCHHITPDFYHQRMQLHSMITVLVNILDL